MRMSTQAAINLWERHFGDDLPDNEVIVEYAERWEKDYGLTENVTDQLVSLVDLREDINAHTERLLDDLDEGEYDEDKHDISVTVGGRTHRLEYNADLYDGLMRFIDDQILMESEGENE